MKKGVRTKPYNYSTCRKRKKVRKDSGSARIRSAGNSNSCNVYYNAEIIQICLIQYKVRTGYTDPLYLFYPPF